MPPKKDAKKGAPVGNYKAGRALKDILPPNIKPPREGVQVKMEGEPDVQRSYTYLPMPKFPEWVGNEEAKNYNFSTGLATNEDGTVEQFVDDFEFYLPPSFKDLEKGEIHWLRPGEYLREIAYETEMSKRKAEKKTQIQKKKTMRRQSILAMGAATSMEDLNNLNASKAVIQNDPEEKKNPISKEEIQMEFQCINYDMRLETEEEVKRRKDEAEKLAAQDKNAKKKPPPKGQAAQDPLDEPQMIKVAVENSMDMGFLMPIYSKWATSQLQFVKDRSIRDIDTRERVWQRIYPQEGGIPILSPSGRYWVKLKFLGKERLIEIDDRMPCDSKRKLMLPRSINNFEIWPQLLMKAILKLYSYKWYQDNALFDNEVGDGCIIHSLTGLIPEQISFKDFEKDGIELLRKILSDDFYFNKKSYATCFCNNEFRPKLPSQATTLKKIDFGDGQDKGSPYPSMDGGSELNSPTLSVQTSSGKMLGRLRDAATLAISVTTGRKLNIQSKIGQSSHVITGFGYALMDIFENQFVDMDAIVKKKDEIEEVKSPFMSPAKKRRAPGLSKDEWRKKRKEEKKREQEEKERREKEPPKQHTLIKIKTSVGRYPVINYLSAFTNDEITEGKKCLLNHIRRPPTPPPQISSPLKSEFKGTAGAFTLNVQSLDNNPPPTQENLQEEQKKEEEKKPMIDPKTRAAGGVWLSASDFPHSFQHIIVYHNINKIGNQDFYMDKWQDAQAPYISNEKDVIFRLDIDPEAYQGQIQSHAQSLDISKPSLNQSAQEQSLNIDESKIEPGSFKAEEYKVLPGEFLAQAQSVDQLLLAFAPYPTATPYHILPRYLIRLQQIDALQYDPAEFNQSQEEIQADIVPMDITFKQYMDGKLLTLNRPKCEEQTIWLKPNVIAPQGFALWIASPVRKISQVSRSEYLAAQKGFFLKNYQFDYLPQERGKYHMFAKYDFLVQEETIFNMKIDMPSDKYLLNFMRILIVDKEEQSKTLLSQTENQVTYNQMRLDNLVLQPNNGKGYMLVIEGAMPYNTTEGTLSIEVLSNKEAFQLEEVVHTEPLDYSDKYYPSKYGIIFKEKVMNGPEHVATALNIRLRKDGVDFDELGLKKLFRLQVLDQGKVVFEKEGFNQITQSHFLFRSNQGLPEFQEGEEEEESKHAYVIQALFDLDEWPDCKNPNNEDLQGVTWNLKLYSSDTLAVIKDTDKEDREKALKASWEQAEPGRAEKAKKSRQKFVLEEKKRKGEELTEEEVATLEAIGQRERVRKKDEVEVPAKGGAKGGKAPPAKGKEDKKQAAKAQEVQQQKEEEKQKKPLPEPDQHVNSEIRDFLFHFKSDRLIQINCDKATQSRQRTEQEKLSLQEQRQKDVEQALAELQEEKERKEQEKEAREKARQEFIAEMEESRNQYKGQIQEIMNERNQYRDMISARKDKEKAIQDMLGLDKIDMAALQKAIDECKEALGRQEIIERGEMQLQWLKYSKEIEVALQAAVQEKNKENILSIIEKIEREQIQIEPKVVNDAKNAAGKIK